MEVFPAAQWQALPGAYISGLLGVFLRPQALVKPGDQAGGVSESVGWLRSPSHDVVRGAWQLSQEASQCFFRPFSWAQ